MSEPKFVIIESPYAGEVTANVKYARACMADAFKRGETPFASHLLYTQEGILDDLIPEERRRGIEAGFAWAALAGSRAVRAVYMDLGVSDGMLKGIAHAKKLDQHIDYRKLYSPMDLAIQDIRDLEEQDRKNPPPWKR
jgi:hypothetical protein